jgi:type VI secretion system secreted protein VgrG
LMDQALGNASEEKIKRKPKRMLNFSG